MIDKIAQGDCTGCGICADVCPKGCIKMVVNKEGFNIPEIDRSECINCGVCENVCPSLSSSKEDGNMPIKAYAAWHKCNDVYMDSSSGGAFTALAQFIVEAGGIVFGAAYDEKGKVCHMGIENIAEIGKLRRAKYVQSETAGIYIKVKQEVQKKRPVMFVGTPCQAAAVFRMWHKKPDNLIIVEFICHGLSSHKYFQLGKANLERKYKSKIVDLEFHSKRRSWRSNTVHIELENGKEKELSSFENPYMYGFFKNITLRESCYHCPVKKEKRNSDIILADFWEIKKIAPKLEKYNGVSMVLVLTEQGDELLNSVSYDLEMHEVDCQKVCETKKHLKAYNYDMEKRSAFMQDVEANGYDHAEKTYLKPKIYYVPLKKVKDYILVKLKRR